MNIEILIGKLLNYYKIKTLNDLAIKLDTTQSTISGWKARNAIGALTDTVANKDPEALEFIFSSNSNINELKDSKENQIVSKDLSKYFIALESVAVATSKEDELVSDIKELVKKYIG